MSDKGVDTDMEGETIMEMEAKEVGMEVEDMVVEEMEGGGAVAGGGGAAKLPASA